MKQLHSIGFRPAPVRPTVLVHGVEFREPVDRETASQCAIVMSQLHRTIADFRYGRISPNDRVGLVLTVEEWRLLCDCLLPSYMDVYFRGGRPFRFLGYPIVIV